MSTDQETVKWRIKYDSKFFPTDLKELANDNFIAIEDLELHKRFDGILPGTPLRRIAEISEGHSKLAQQCRLALEFAKEVFVALMFEDGRHINKKTVVSLNPAIPHVEPYQRVKEVKENWTEFAKMTVWLKTVAGPRDNEFFINQRLTDMRRTEMLEWLKVTMEEIDVNQLAERVASSSPDGSRGPLPIAKKDIENAGWIELRKEIAPQLDVRLVGLDGKTKNCDTLRADCLAALKDLRSESSKGSEGGDE